MNMMFLQESELGFASPGSGIVPNAGGGRFNQVVDLVRGGLDTYRETRGLPQYYPAPQPPPQLPAPGPAPAAARQSQDGAEEGQRGGRRGSSGGGFGLSWDNAGLHIGDSITLSPTMLVIGAVGIYLLQSAPVGRRR